MDLNVSGIDHLYVSVRDLKVSEPFYDRVMQALGFRKSTRMIAGEPHAHYFNRVLRPERPSTQEVANIYASEAPATGESFEPLAQLGGSTIERILSSNTPATDLYDQQHDEWVILLRGAATLEIAGQRIQLLPGHHVTLPARTPHRVLETTAGTLWLAVHEPKA
jgi:cupin 2 domain-containing protein